LRDWGGKKKKGLTLATERGGSSVEGQKKKKKGGKAGKRGKKQPGKAKEKEIQG